MKDLEKPKQKPADNEIHSNSQDVYLSHKQN